MHAAYSPIISLGRSREGAWIEITTTFGYFQRIGRSREGAWIEILSPLVNLVMLSVAPVRERGLKSREDVKNYIGLPSLP